MGWGYCWYEQLFCILFCSRLEPPSLKGALGIHFERGSAASHSGMNIALFLGLDHLQYFHTLQATKHWRWGGEGLGMRLCG